MKHLKIFEDKDTKVYKKQHNYTYALLDAADDYEKKTPKSTIGNAFIAGAKWAKEQNNKK
jgi:hypothetical protein